MSQPRNGVALKPGDKAGAPPSKRSRRSAKELPAPATNDCSVDSSPVATLSSHEDMLAEDPVDGQDLSVDCVQSDGQGEEDNDVPSYRTRLSRQRKVEEKIDRSKDPFTVLSDEIVLHIFSFLPKKALFRCSLVSRRFNSIAADESLWSCFDLGGRSVRSTALGRAILRGVQVLRLAQTTIASPIFAPAESPTVTGWQSRLQYLDLSMAHISCAGLYELLACCSRLKKLSLEHCRVDNMVCAVIAQNQHLDTLNLAMVEGLTVAGCFGMLANLHRLEALNLSWTNLNAPMLLQVVSCLTPNLRQLNMAGFRKWMTDELVAKLVRRCPRLVELDLSDCAGLTERTVQYVANLERLQYLSLSRCYGIDHTAFVTVNKLVFTLTCLDMFGVLTAETLVVLRNAFPGVQFNQFKHTSIARPTVGTRRTSIWGQRTRD